MATVLDDLKCLISQVEDSCCSNPCQTCTPTFSAPDFPYLQVTILDPPCTTAPTAPKYVKPLTLPCPPKCPNDPEYDFKIRFANFYNRYNIDFRKTGKEFVPREIPRRKYPSFAATVDGKFPKCNDCPRIVGTKCADHSGCPTGFKPCYMELCPPPCNCKLSSWTATIMPCPPKRKCCK